MNKKVSVIIPAFNSESYISEAIESALAQTYRDTEIVVVDDGSWDNTGGIVASYASNGMVKYIYQENKGPGAARNTGIEISAGEIVAFLDADDVWEKEKIEKQMELFRKPEVGLVYSDMGFIGREGAKYSEGTKGFKRGMVLKDLLKNNFIPTSSVIARKAVVREAGLFSEERKLTAIEDYDMWIRIARKNEIDYSEETLARYRVHENQISKGRLRGYKSLIILFKHLLEKKSGERGLMLKRLWENRIKYVIFSLQEGMFK